ncbi:hypothetical protein [Haladaptatus salinisoli]|uniref:hypothetical protein n=1 Tax=Haladaptatus salinisoli TaxID=2884876 RepID=UPI001D0ACA23|nr:hypothetical protein [Haladaptatus salinisoli]
MAPERTEIYLIAIVALLAIIASLLVGVVVSLGSSAIVMASFVFVLFAVAGFLVQDRVSE